jgi:hypothetical protein
MEKTMKHTNTPSTQPAWSLLIGLCIAATLLHTPVSAEIYKWTDASGEVQYSQVPPPGGVKTEKIQGARPPADNPDVVNEALQKQVDAMNKTNAEKAKKDKEKEMEKELAATNKGNCVTAQDNLIKLEEGGRRRYLTTDGEVTRFTEEERQARISAAKEEIEKYCNP